MSEPHTTAGEGGQTTATSGGAGDPAGAAGGQQQTADPRAAFVAQIPETIRGEAYFKDIGDVPALATKAFHQAKLIGRDPASLVVVPGADATPEAWAQIYDRLGRPANGGGYTFSAPADLPAGLNLDPELQKRFAAKAHEAGLNQRQVEALYSWWNGERTQSFTVEGQRTAQRTTEAVEKLRADPSFGGAAFDRNVGRAQNALAHYGTPELVAELERSGLGDHPELVKAFAKLGLELEEDGVLGRAGQGGQGALTPDEARQRRSTLMADKDFMARYRSPNREIRQAAINEMLEINKFIGGAPQAP